MATVVDLSLSNGINGKGTDRTLSTPNRIVAAAPLNSITAEYVGEIVKDATTGNLWVALGSTANSAWTPVVIGT